MPAQFWEVQLGEDRWIPLPASISEELCQAQAAGSATHVCSMKGIAYKMDLRALTQTNATTGRSRPIRVTQRPHSPSGSSSHSPARSRAPTGDGGDLSNIAPDERPMGVRWEVQDDRGGWACFHKDTIAKLENAFYLKTPEVEIPSGATRYVIKPVTEATWRYNAATGRKRAVRRVNGQTVAADLVWAWMDNDGTWQTYDSGIQRHIHHCASNLVKYAEFTKAVATIMPGRGTEDMGKYQLLFDDMIQQNASTGYRRPVRKMGPEALSRLNQPVSCVWAWQSSDGEWQLFSGDVADKLDMLFDSKNNAAPKVIESAEFGEEKLEVDFKTMVLTGCDSGVEYPLRREPGGMADLFDTGDGALWMFADDDDGWINFDRDTTKLLEVAFIAGKPLVDLPGGEYQVLFLDMKRKNVKTGKARQVRRVECDSAADLDATTRVRDDTVIPEPQDSGKDWVPTKQEGPVDLREYDALIAKLRASGEKFTDPEFEPIPISFYGNRHSKLPSKKCKFLRMDKMPGDFVFSRGPLAPGDIKQGCLGSCWFVSMLSAVAERKDLIDKLLPRQTLQPTGAYVVCFYQNGERKPVIVDDHFPVWDYPGCPSGMKHGIATTRGASNQLWVPLMEKAYAKIHGSYSALTGGLSSDALSDLTGAPTTTIDLPWKQKGLDVEKLWSDLTRYNRLGYLFGGHCGRDRKEIASSVVKKMGLVEKHAYTVLKFREAQLRGKTHRLVLLRNPYGRHEWQGDWSDKSRLWTPELRQELGHQSQEDGVFWMPYHDFLTYFHVINVCKVPQTTTFEFAYEHKWINLNPPTCMMMDFKVVKSDTISTVQVFQESKRGKTGDFTLNDLHAIVARVHNTGAVERIMDELLMLVKKTGLVMASFALEPGRYRIYVFTVSGARRSLNHPQSCVIRLSTTESVLMKQMAYSPSSLRSALHLALDDIRKTCTHGKTKGALHCNTHEVMPGVYLMEVHSPWGRFVLCINKTGQACRVKYDHSKSRGVLTTRVKDQVIDVVPPRARQLLLTVCHFPPQGKFVGTINARSAALSHTNHDPPLAEGSLHAPVSFK